MYTAILKKEFHHHRTFTLACIGLCCLLHGFIYCISPPTILLLGNLCFAAYYFSLFYVCAAAAIVYAVEHDNNTFGFLRKLPVSPLTIALGKTLWVLISSGIVITCLFLSAWFWHALFYGNIFLFWKELFAPVPGYPLPTKELVFIFVELFLWGLFWSTRCRRQMFAVVAAFLCHVLAFANSALLLYFATANDDYHFLCRLIIAAIVAIFALRGMLHWFDPEKKRSFLWRKLTEHRVLFRYPKRIQSPFFALFHQQIRSASSTYPFGLFCFALMIFLCIYTSFAEISRDAENLFFFAWLTSIFGILLFWGTIFGADQKDHSYRFLMRLGIHEGTIWRSRILIPLVFYLPVLAAGLFYGQTHKFDGAWDLTFGLTFCLWFAPVALGSFFSIMCRSQVTSVVATFGGTYVLLIWTMYFLVGIVHVGGSRVSPLLTTLPICIAFLIASRWRAKYWLRDKPCLSGWRRVIMKHQTVAEPQS